MKKWLLVGFLVIPLTNLAAQERASIEPIEPGTKVLLQANPWPCKKPQFHIGRLWFVGYVASMDADTLVISGHFSRTVLPAPHTRLAVPLTTITKIDVLRAPYTTITKNVHVKTHPNNSFLKARFRAGLGVTSQVGPTVVYRFSASLGHHQISLYTLKAEDWELTADRDPTKKMSDWGILYGGTWKLGRGWIDASVGVNKVRGTLHGKLLRQGRAEGFFNDYRFEEYKKRPLDAIGIPMVVEIGLHQGALGVSLYGFGNYNSEQPYGGCSPIM